MFDPRDLNKEKIMKIMLSENSDIYLKEAFAYLLVNTKLFTKEILQKIRNNLDKIFALNAKQGKNDVEIMELQFISLIKEICCRLYFYDKLPSEIFISKKVQKWMAKELVCQYLSISLEKNPDLRQTIPEFYSQLHPKMNRFDKIITEDMKYLYDNRDVYLENIKIQRVHNSEQFPNNSEKGTVCLDDGKFNILELYLFEAMHQVKSIKMFLKLFFKNTIPFEIQSNKSRFIVTTDGIKKAYLSLNESLQAIKIDGLFNEYTTSNGITDNALVKSERNFVCSWFVFRKLELTYRFCMTFFISQVKNKKDYSLERFKIMYEAIPVQFFYNLNENIDYSPFLLSKKSVYNLCTNNILKNDELELETIRIVGNIALAIYYNLYSSHNHLSWSDDNFIKTAYYIKSTYRFEDYFPSINGDEDDAFWKNVAETYKEISSETALKNYRRIKKESR